MSLTVKRINMLITTTVMQCNSCKSFLSFLSFLSDCSDSEEGDGVSSETLRKAEGQSQGGTQLGQPAGPRYIM